jgi:hypothetical protein
MSFGSSVQFSAGASTPLLRQSLSPTGMFGGKCADPYSGAEEQIERAKNKYAQ